jgi:sugar lactone lactonase YvrE
MMDFTEADRGRAGIFRYDLDTGRLVRRYLLETGTGGHSTGDITVSPAGDAYVSDSRAHALYVISRGDDRLVPFLEGQPFKSPQGLDFSRDGKLLYVADYAEGVFAVDMASKEVKKLPVPERIALFGIDGLSVHGGHLIAIQNGINPHRVVRILLSADGAQVTGMEVLEANNPLFDEPTLGVVVGDLFYYIANSQWTAFDEEGNLAPLEELHEHVIMKTKL